MPRRNHLDRDRARRCLAMALLVGTIASLSLAGAGSVSAHAAPTTTASTLTVSWAGDTSRAEQYQPDRAATAPGHAGDFNNLRVTVSQTQDLIDQTIRVTVNGMPGATTPDIFGHQIATNFVQAMQCWGDPNAANFAQTCQWGFLYNGRYNAYKDTADPLMGSRSDAGFGDVNSVPYLAPWGQQYRSYWQPDPTNPRLQIMEMNSLANGTTTNENPIARVGSGGSGWFDFAVQTSDAAPHLGCGLDKVNKGAGTRCWLVLIPRGTHDCTGAPSSQYGSPIDQTTCWWRDRMLVPLDFQPTGATCPSGSAEAPVAGSVLLTGAMSSWQLALCRSVGTTYSFASINDSVARDQLLSGQNPFIVTGRPLTKDTVSPQVAGQLDTANIVYAPLAISGATMAFYVETFKGRAEQVTLSPLLLAKLLTFSYREQIPWSDLGWANLRTKGFSLIDDPEFIRLNPTFPRIQDFRPGVIMVGTGSDAQALMWKYLQSDDRARAFLRGDAVDGDQINRYYLPKGHPDAIVPATYEVTQANGIRVQHVQTDQAGNTVYKQVGLANPDGTPYCLCDTAIDTVPWADQSTAPDGISTSVSQTRRYDLVQYNPPRNNLTEVAQDIANRNPKSKTLWDPTIWITQGVFGDYVADQAAFYTPVMGITDTNSAERYGISVMDLQLPNQQNGTPAQPTTAGMLAAVSYAQMDTGVGGVTVTDPTKLSGDAYPLTQISWGAFRLDGSTTAQRKAYADFIEYATTTGQVSGTSSGQLPYGYAPLTDQLKQQALAAVKRIREYVPPAADQGTALGGTTGSATSADSTGSTTNGQAPGAGAPNNAGAPSDASSPGAVAPGSGKVTPGSGIGSGSALTATKGAVGTTTALIVLGSALMLGAGGAVVVPLLLRRPL